MDIIVDTQVACQDDDHPPPSTIEQWVNTALTHCSPQSLNAAELTVRIVDETEIRELNHQYRGKDSTTNVLSFPAELPDPIDLPLLGDLVICAAVVNREAQEQDKPMDHHWAHMITHGCLHLLGYDHIEDSDADIMEAREIEILATLGIANPYIERDILATIPTTTVNL